MNDIMEIIGKSLVQHGKSSDRVYLIKLSKDDYPKIIDKINNLAISNSYSKIFIKVPKWAQKDFELAGYDKEAYIPNFYNGKEDAFFMSRFLDSCRKKNPNAKLIEEIIAFTKNIKPLHITLELNSNYSFGMLSSKDIQDMATIYKKVFKTYPFPIHSPVYLEETMNNNVIYFGIREKGQLIAVSSCEMDKQSQNAEMTDFATMPEYRSQGLASFLLSKMEHEMQKREIITAYTIARAVSYGMNITFAKHNYVYSGTLINNTNISGKIESMNVWYKTL